MKTIGIAAAEALSNGQRRLFAALAEVFGFRTFECGYEEGSPVDAWVFPAARQSDLSRIEASTLPCFVVLNSGPAFTCADSGLVEFADVASVPRVLRGRKILSEDSPGVNRLPPWLSSVSAVAWKDGLPVWAVRSAPGRNHHHVATPLPELAEDEAVYLHFSQNRFLALLPLFVFLREVTEDPRWEEPPIQACFMFDDPNLHWSTYGYIDFDEMTRHAQQHDYHVSSATIPLDSWFVHEPTAALFRKYPHRISLLMHGNDHVNEELARNVQTNEQLGTLVQALRRIEKLERRSGVEVSRVMAPPHGACSEETLANMALLGYEAACVSRGSLRNFNRGASWVRNIGMSPSDILRGLTVLPRFRIAPNCQNSILMSVLLRQPIIPVGHHQDVADGLGLFADLAAFINSLGDVKWGSMAQIARRHHSQTIDVNVLHLKMHTKRADILVPAGIDRVVVHRPWLEADSGEPLRLVSAGADTPVDVANPELPIAVRAGQRVTILSGPPPSLLGRRAERHGLRPWPVVRRLFTEGRDRLAPTLRRA